jgi:hypothetical protein
MLWPTILVGQRGMHVDGQFGFKLKIPSKWQRASVEKDRRLVRGRYLSRRTYPIKGSRWDHMPEMRVIVFPKAASARARELQEAEGVQAWVPDYLDYSDYVTRNLGGELTVLETSQSKAAGVPCTQFRIRRKTESGAPTYIIQTYVFELAKAHAAVEFMVAEQHVSKVQKQISSVFAGFKVVTPDPKAAANPFDLPLWITNPERWQELPMRDRLEQRSKYEQVFLGAVKADAQSGWRVQKTKHFIVISKAPNRYTADVAKVAELCREWCDEHFGSITEETVMPAVIRIFESTMDYNRYRARSKRSHSYVPEIREVVFTPRRDPARNAGALRSLHQGLIYQFLSDKDHRLYRHIPAWTLVGLYYYLRQTKLDRSKLEFVVGETEKSVVRQGMRAGDLGKIRALIQHAVPTVEDEEYRLRYQRGRLVRLIASRQSPFGKGFLAEYVIGVRTAMTTLKVAASNAGAGLVPGQTEDSIAAAEKTRGEVLDKLRVTVNAAVCDFGPAGWQKIEAAYMKFNKRL